MDPNATRATMVEKANVVLATANYSTGDGGELAAVATELAESVHALDEWLRMAGFLPEAWTTPGNENAHRRMSTPYADTTVQTHRTGGVCGWLIVDESQARYRCVLDAGHYGGHSPDTG